MAKERSILFSGDMVRAILNGRKTQTRRPVKPQPAGEWAAPGRTMCPLGQVGDHLWVRETWGIADLFLSAEYALAQFNSDEDCAAYIGEVPGHYNLDEIKDHVVYREDHDRPFFWRPSIHMPRWASRIDLEITGVRVERVQQISHGDCYAEGSRWPVDEDDEGGFINLWNGIYATKGYGWDANPWVWVLEFRRIETPDN